MEQLPNNSHRKQHESKEPPKLERIVKGEVKTRQPGFATKLKNTFFAGRADIVVEHVFWDVVIPSARDTILDSGISFLEGMVGRGRGNLRQNIMNAAQSRGSYGGVGIPGPQTNYRAAFQGNQTATPAVMSTRDKAMHNFQQLIIPSRVEAESIIDALYLRIAEYNAVTLADLYDLCGITVAYTDDKYGWTNLEGAGVIRVRDGFTLDLPRPEPLD